MEDLYVNVNFASTFLLKSIVLFMSYVEFSELEFKWSIHVIDALNQLHATHTSISLLFTMIYFYHGSEKCEKTPHATTNMAIFILKYVLQCTIETI